MQRSGGCSQPVVHDAVALQAIRGKTLCLVVGRFCLSKVVQMTTHALGRQALAIKGTDRTYLVTGITVDRRVRPDQREAVLMLIDVVDRDLPSGVAMTEIALGGVLSAMDIRVAVLALIADFREHEVAVAILATNALVHPPEGETGLAMFELQNVTKRLPPLRGMAILAGYLQRTVSWAETGRFGKVAGNATTARLLAKPFTLIRGIDRAGRAQESLLSGNAPVTRRGIAICKLDLTRQGGMSKYLTGTVP